MSAQFQVYRTKCNECLFSKNKIVSEDRKKEIIEECVKQGNEKHFVCHKASMKNKNVCCRGFYNLYGFRVAIIQIAQRLHFIEFIEQD
jgi:hypothetical protein